MAKSNDDFVVPDLSPQAAWPRQPDEADDAWLTKIACLPVEELLLRMSDSVSKTNHDEPILVRDLQGWRAGRYVGEIRHGGRTLRLVPRLGPDVIVGWVSTILNVKVLPNAAGTGPATGSLVIQLAAAIWRAAVLDAGKHALPRVKGKRAHLGYGVRGRLDVAATAQLRARGDARLESSDRYRSLDNAAVAVVVAADRLLARHLDGSNWRGARIDEQLTKMRAAVGSRPPLPSREDLSRVRYTPITIKWRRAADLSHLIASQKMFRTSATAETTQGLLIDVAELWELFLLACAGQATDDTVIHGTRTAVDRTLITSTVEPRQGLGALYPDIIVKAASPSTCLVIDAKYKRLIEPRGVDRADLYQVYAYAQAFEAQRALLAYPETRRGQSRAESLGPWRGANTTLFEFQRLPVTTSECIGWFERWFAQEL